MNVTRRLSLTGMGFSLSADALPPRSRLVMRLLSSLPAALRERTIFSSFASQKAVQRVFGGPKEVEVTFENGALRGCAFLLNTAEKYFLVGESVERDLRELVVSRLGESDAFYDVGAYIGMWSLFVWRATGCKVVAFEPSTHNFARLSYAIGSSHAPIVCINAAVSDKQGTMHLSEEGSCSSLGAQSGTAVRTLRLDDVVNCGFDGQTPPPSFIKIDVEGHAPECLSGARRLLTKHKPAILCELHDAAEDEATRGLLVRFGYTIRDVDAHAIPPRVHHILAT